MNYQKALDLIEKAERIDLAGGDEENCRQALSECDEALTHLFKLVGGECKLTDSEEEFKKIINLQKRQLEMLATRSLEMQEENRKLVELIENPSSPTPSSPMSPSHSPKSIIQQAVQEAQLLQQLAQRSANFEKDNFSQQSIYSPSRNSSEAKTLQHEISLETKRLIEIAQRSAALKQSTGSTIDVGTMPSVIRSENTGTSTDPIDGLQRSTKPIAVLHSPAAVPSVMRSASTGTSTDPVDTPKRTTKTLDVGTSVRVSPACFLSPPPPSTSVVRSLPKSPAPPRHSQRCENGSPKRVIISPADDHSPMQPTPPLISEIPPPKGLSIDRERSWSPGVSPCFSDVTKEGTQEYLDSLTDVRSLSATGRIPLTRPLSPSFLYGDGDPLLPPPRRIHFPTPPSTRLPKVEEKPEPGHRCIAVYPKRDSSLRTSSQPIDSIPSNRYSSKPVMMMSPKDDSRQRSHTTSVSGSHRRTLSPLVVRARSPALVSGQSPGIVNNIKELSPATECGSQKVAVGNIKTLSPAVTSTSPTTATITSEVDRTLAGCTLLRRLSASSSSSPTVRAASISPVLMSPIRSPLQPSLTSPIRSSPAPLSETHVESTSPIRRSSVPSRVVMSPSISFGSDPPNLHPVERIDPPVEVEESPPASTTPEPPLPPQESKPELEPETAEPELDLEIHHETAPVTKSPDQATIDSEPVLYTPPSVAAFVTSPPHSVKQSPIVAQTPQSKYRDVTVSNSVGFGTRYFELEPATEIAESIATKEEEPAAKSSEPDIPVSSSLRPMGMSTREWIWATIVVSTAAWVAAAWDAHCVV